MRHDEDEGHEEHGRKAAATVSGIVAVEHDAVPILACRDREEKREALMEVVEVLPVTDHIALFHLIEQSISQHSHDEKDQHQENKDVDERGD